MGPIEQVERDLIAERADAMTPETARRIKLGAWAYYTAGPDTALKRECAKDFAHAWTRYRGMQAAVSELLASWSAAGIDATIFKGYALVELAYPHAAVRHLTDIDIYVPPTQTSEALTAIPQGWIFHACEDQTAFHETGYLRTSTGRISVDIHRSFFAGISPEDPAIRERTRKILEKRVAIDIGGVQMRCLAPLDLAVVGLAVNRGWGGDRWVPKSHDYLDLVYLRHQCGLSESAIEHRARELGLAKTWQCFSKSCNPYRQTCDLATARRSLLYRLKNDWATRSETRALSRHLLRAGRALQLAGDLRAVTRAVLQVYRELQNDADISVCVARPIRPPRRVMCSWRITRSVRWATRVLLPIVGHDSERINLLRTVTTYRLFAAKEIRAQWVCATAAEDDRTGGEQKKYFWLERDGALLANTAPALVPQRLNEVLRVGAMTDHLKAIEQKKRGSF